jgi:hypothetical protein
MIRIVLVLMFFPVVIFFYFCTNHLVTEQDIGKSIISNTDRDSTAFKYTMQGFPKKILKYMGEKCSEDTFVIANPYDQFRASDFIEKSEQGLPIRRLIFWNKNKMNYYTICYERGGRSHNCVVAQFRIVHNVKNLYFAPMRMSVKDYHNIDSIFSNLKRGSIYYRPGVDIEFY